MYVLYVAYILKDVLFVLPGLSIFLAAGWCVDSRRCLGGRLSLLHLRHIHMHIYVYICVCIYDPASFCLK